MGVKVFGKIEIVLIRAGKTRSGEDNLYLGWSDEPLLDSETERLETRSNDGTYPKVQRVYTSPTARCISTAHIIYRGIPAIAITGLGPFDMGALEGKSKEQAGKKAEEIPDLELVINRGSYRFAALVEKSFGDMIGEAEKVGIERMALITHRKVIDVIVSSHAIPRSIQHIIDVDYGGGVALEHDLDTDLSRIAQVF